MNLHRNKLVLELWISKMLVVKFKVEMFDRTNNFVLWHIKKKKGFVGARWPWESTRRKSCISPNYARCKKEVYHGEDFECDPTQLVKQSSLGVVQSKFGAGVVVKARVAIHDEVLAQLVILEEASIPIMDEF